MTRPRIGVALGGGSARGWAHIGVLEALADLGLAPDVVAGTSIGALVGAAYVTDRLREVRVGAEAVTWRNVATLLDLRLTRGGLIDGARIETLLADRGIACDIERSPMPFAAVAADIESGAEVWLRSGPIQRAVRASIGLPGIFKPVQVDGQWLLDGGLVNPVPVSTCRALGADVVIAIDINSSRLWPTEAAPGPPTPWHSVMGRLLLARSRGPASFVTMAKAVTIMQVQITKARLVHEPADVVLVPNLGNVGPFQFDRARAAIAAGRAAVERSREALAALQVA